METSQLICCKSMDWFLYHRNLRHERVKGLKRADQSNNTIWESKNDQYYSARMFQTQLAFIYSKFTIETLEQSIKYVQS